MRCILRKFLKERLTSKNKKNFKLSTISLFNIKRILRINLDYIRSKFTNRSLKWIDNYSDRRELLANLIKKIEEL